MTITLLPAVGDPDTDRLLGDLLLRLPGVRPLQSVGDSARLLDTLAVLGAGPLDDLPHVVLVHERIGPVPALELVREIALRFPATGVILVTADAGPALYAAAMDCGARGLAVLPLTAEDLGARVQAAAHWAVGVRRHLGGGDSGGSAAAGGPAPGGTLVAVAGAKGGVGTTVTAVQLALAAGAAGRTVALADMDLQSGDVASYLDVQFRRSAADLAGISDISPRVLQDALYPHPAGVALLLAPAEGERGEDVGDLASRQITAALRARYDVVVVDCGTQITAAGAAVIETADVAVLVTTPDVVAVRAAKRMVRLWERLRIRTPEETTTVVNRHTRHAEIQPSLVARTTGTRTARTTVPAGYKELQGAVDAGRMQDLDPRSAVRQALWGLAAELGLTAPPRRRHALEAAARGGTGADQLTPVPAGGRFRRRFGDRGQTTVEFVGILPLILVALAVIWQCVLVGYAYSLAGHAADKAARAGAVGRDCTAVARADLPAAWHAEPDCGTSGPVYRATVRVRVPVLFPGAVNLPWSVTGTAGVARED
ncbi:P-loop NTPase [Streptomyces sp. NPDC049585]|uniref:AAA family ATPase n=1 Tax=Streptomyces sp. NPDC049585 TaxID=3155154 RepID=UPI00343461DB